MKPNKPMYRRQFLQTVSFAGAGITVPPAWYSQHWNIPDDGLKTTDYLGEVKVETRIDDSEIFTEGPAVDHMGQVYFTNIPVNKILKWNPETKELSVFRTNSQGANGLRFTMDGDLLVCEGNSGKVTRIHLKSGQASMVADQFEGKGLQSPNDVDFDSRGRIYFSSRTNDPDLRKENVRSVYRVDPDGKIIQLLAEPEIHMPNGVVVSPDERTLYVIEAHPDTNRNRCILAFDLRDDGAISNQRTLYDFYPGRSGDGMCIDNQGNLYVAAGLHNTRGTSETLATRPGIHVISPQGKLLAYQQTPEDTITNCSFGGKDLQTLYVTCGSYLLSIRTSIPGKSTYRPKV